MASQGVSLQNKVAKLLSRRGGKPLLKPNRALVLADRVANRKLGLGEASCVTEMSVMMACWKQNAFGDAACSNEIDAFFTCAKKAQTVLLNNNNNGFNYPAPRLSDILADRKSGLDQEPQAGRYPPKQINQLLKRFPNIKREI
uniref:Coiled-coil-helix-coiled-coil-helix domain containing 1 n=1 Tax=Leptobrachium leishanense TaxID=445787 RepID=A0A8C5QY71_9ANUR